MTQEAADGADLKTVLLLSSPSSRTLQSCPDPEQPSTHQQTLASTSCWLGRWRTRPERADGWNRDQDARQDSSFWDGPGIGFHHMNGVCKHVSAHLRSGSGFRGQVQDSVVCHPSSLLGSRISAQPFNIYMMKMKGSRERRETKGAEDGFTMDASSATIKALTFETCSGRLLLTVVGGATYHV